MKGPEKIVGIIFSLIGVVCLIGSFFIVPSTLNYENKIDTVGTITKIITSRGSDGNLDHEVYVSHELNGITYEGRLNGYSSSYDEGDEIDIYYDKDNPNKIGVKGLDLLVLMFPGFGVIFLSVGVLLLVRINAKKRLLEKLKTTGMMVQATYVETRLNTNYTVNGRSPYVIVCDWLNPSNNQTYRFVSENLWNDPGAEIMSYSITSFPVYIDPQNPNKYAMDVKAILPNAK